jgi:hypothetical protein
MIHDLIHLYRELVWIVKWLMIISLTLKMDPLFFIKAIQSELKHMDQIFQSFSQKVPREDPRLTYPVVYLKCCMAPARVIDRFLHEQFSYCPLDDDKR